jgi:hypothetical protein
MSGTVLRRADGVSQIRPPLRRRAARAVDPALEVVFALLLGAAVVLAARVPPRLAGAVTALCLAHAAWRALAARRRLRRPLAAVAPLGRARRRQAS